MNESGEHTLMKPTDVKPAVVPESSLSLFASPVAQKALRLLNGEENKEQNYNESDNSKSEVDDGRNADNLEEGEEGIKSRSGWTVVARTVAASPRASTRLGRRASVAPDHRCLSPAPPKFDRSRRMSLSPSRYPLLSSRSTSPAPLENIKKTSSNSNLEATNTSLCVSEGGLSKSNESVEHTLVKPVGVPEIPLSLFASPEEQKALRFVNGEESEERNNNADKGEKLIKSRYVWTRVGSRVSPSPSRVPLPPSRPISPAPLDEIKKNSRKCNSEVRNTSSSHELKTKSQNSSCRPTIDVKVLNPAIARPLSRRRFSLPITPSSQLTIPHPPSHSPRRRSLATPTISSSQPPWTGNKRTPAAGTLQSNRHKLEALMKERSRAVADLSIPLRQDSKRMLPAPIRVNYSLARASLSRRSSITSETDSDDTQPDTFETISLLDVDGAARLDAMIAEVIDMGSSPPSDVMSNKSEPPTSPRHLTASPNRLVVGRPVFKRRGSCSLDPGSSIALSDTASVTSDQESTSSTTNQTHDELPGISRLRTRRGTICMGSLSAMMALSPGESNRRSSSSSSPCPSKNLNHRSNGNIEEGVEEEIQKRIMKRKSQLLIPAAPGSIDVPPAGRNTKARANSKTPKGRLQTIMGNLTMERTTAELLSMTAAMDAAANRREFDHIQKSKSLDSD